MKTPTRRTWKCTGCIMQMSYLYASQFPFKKFCKLAQHAEKIRKKCLGKELQTRVQRKSTDQDKPRHISICFSPQYQRQKQMFFQSASWTGTEQHIDASNMVWTLIGDGKLANQITGSASSKYVVYATACVYKELYGKITDRKKKCVNNYLIWNKVLLPQILSRTCLLCRF